MKINKKKLGFVILVFLAVIVLTGFTVDFVRFPECYLTTWEKQLQEDINNGDAEMIEYYERNYKANNRILFEECGK